MRIRYQDRVWLQYPGEAELKDHMALRDYQAKVWGETIYVKGASSIDINTAMSHWIGSSVHNEVMSTRFFTAAGCAILESNRRFFYVCNFGDELP